MRESDSGGEERIKREDIRVSTHDGHPSLRIGDAEIVLKTHFEGAPAESAETDHYDEWPFFVLDFDQEYFDGLLEIAPEYIRPDDGGHSSEIGDGTRENPYRFVVHEEDRATISYGPGRDDEPGEWTLTIASEETGRVELLLDKAAMYELWTEVQGVPWPREHSERAELRRRLVEYARGADAEGLRDALEELVDDPEVVPDGGVSPDDAFRIVLVQCTGQKRDEEAPARELYDESDYFLKQREYAEAVADEWFIQSALHGLLSPDDVIEPYDVRADDIDDPGEWAEAIANELWARYSTEAVVGILGGKDYADPLTPHLEELGFEVHEPLRGLGIGERKRWLMDRRPPTAEGSEVIPDE